MIGKMLGDAPAIDFSSISFIIPANFDVMLKQGLTTGDFSSPNINCKYSSNNKQI